MKNFIFILMTALMFSCGTGEPMDNPTSEYTIVNATNHNVSLTVYDGYLNYRKDTTFVFTTNSEVVYSHNGHSFGLPFGGDEDSVRIVFDDEKEIMYRRGDGQPRNIIDIESWNSHQVSELFYEYQYFITEEDYDNAVLIK